VWWGWTFPKNRVSWQFSIYKVYGLWWCFWSFSRKPRFLTWKPEKQGLPDPDLVLAGSTLLPRIFPPHTYGHDYTWAMEGLRGFHSSSPQGVWKSWVAWSSRKSRDFSEFPCKWSFLWFWAFSQKNFRKTIFYLKTCFVSGKKQACFSRPHIWFWPVSTRHVTVYCFGYCYTPPQTEIRQ